MGSIDKEIRDIEKEINRDFRRANRSINYINANINDIGKATDIIKLAEQKKISKREATIRLNRIENRMNRRNRYIENKHRTRRR